MGLFILDLETPETKETRVKAAIANLELYLEQGEGYEYLLDFAQNYIKDAQEMEKE